MEGGVARKERRGHGWQPPPDVQLQEGPEMANSAAAQLKKRGGGGEKKRRVSARKAEGPKMANRRGATKRQRDKRLRMRAMDKNAT